ncbi:MAG: queuosine precursor transporter [Spirochaetota bacterium]
MKLTKAIKLYLVLLSVFLTFLLMAELTGAKLIQFKLLSWQWTLTLGVIPFPVTFVITDILNEFYGKRIARFTTYIGMTMVFFAYLLILVDLEIPAIPDSPVGDAAFAQVFFNSKWIIIGSIIAYLIGQIIDIYVFNFLRKQFSGKYIWLRATGSTIISQLIDSYIVIYIAFGIGQGMALDKIMDISNSNFTYKMLVAIASTAFIYLGHWFIRMYLGEKEAEELQKVAAEEE